jgi:hypothetical protein
VDEIDASPANALGERGCEWIASDMGADNLNCFIASSPPCGDFATLQFLSLPEKAITVGTSRICTNAAPFQATLESVRRLGLSVSIAHFGAARRPEATMLQATQW